jgi:catalase (peroxidase I)
VVKELKMNTNNKNNDNDNTNKLHVLKQDLHKALLNSKVIAFPIAVRHAWHASGTFDVNTQTGGSDGATMRFEPERSDPANNGLAIIRDMIHDVKKKHEKDVSMADLTTYAGALAIELAGGPHIPFEFGRTDDLDGKRCPAHGRLPDASKGAQHLRDVFYRMGMDDRDIVALSGGHTLGRCHFVRSGYDGAWTHNPLKFDNEYFRNLIDLKWVPRHWDGELQFMDKQTGKLMMLPTDIALIRDPKFREFVELYAKDQEAFFADFADSYARLLAQGTKCCPAMQMHAKGEQKRKSAKFREAAMHGTVEILPLAEGADVTEGDPGSGRTALHKAAYWGHKHSIPTLIKLGVPLNAQDSEGDTALHDASRFGHYEVVEMLINARGIDIGIKNRRGFDALGLAREHQHLEVAKLLQSSKL